MASSLRTASSFVLSTLLLASLFIQPATAHGGDDGMDEDRPNLKARGLVLVKIYCLVIIFFATFIPGVSPYYLRWNNTFLVLGIQYAGGVFLGTAMLHFLGDSNSTFMDLTPKAYPFAFMLAVSGYLMTMLADVIIQAVYARQPVANRTPPTDLETNATDGKLQSEGDVKSCCGQAPADCSCLNDEAPEVRNIVKATLIKQASWGDAVLLIFALCFHSVFEGIAIGVADTKADAWRNLWTVSLHKSFAAISMGIALLRMLPDRPLLSCATYAFAFAISSPVGVAIGLAIDATTQGPTADWIYAIAMGLAAGIFIFVAINHLLAKGYTPPCKIKADRPLFKFFAVTLGAGTIFVAMIWD